MALNKWRDLAEKHDINTWRDFTPMNTSLGNMLHNMTGSWRFIKPIYEDKIPACQNACPAGNDIEGWIKLLQQNQPQKAYWHLKREQPFPAILGRVCFQFCRDACNRGNLDRPVNIKTLERFIGDQFSPGTPHPYQMEDNGKLISVVGSGPAGMSAAYYGRLLGFKVTIFEKMPEPGGILRVGIPSFRLPRKIIENEFEGLQSMGIKLRLNTAVGKDISVEQIKTDYDYLFIATGCHTSLKLGIDPEDRSKRIASGLSFLKKVAQGEHVDPGRKVAVIGGGNTALDTARTAVRLGCSVQVIYRRSEDEMPAHAEEVRLAREEGVNFRFLAAPVEIILNDDGTIRTLTCCEMELGTPDESGRKRPVQKEGAFFKVQPDMVLTAIGEVAKSNDLMELPTDKNGTVPVDEGMRVKNRTNAPAKIFAGGDITDSPRTVVHAVAAGKRAAIAIDCDRKGEPFRHILEKISIGNETAISFAAYTDAASVNPVSRNSRSVVGPEKIQYDYFLKAAPAAHQMESPEFRQKSFDECEHGFSETAAQEEAARCMHCGRCTECDNCLIFCPDMSVQHLGGDQFGYSIDYDYCKGCSICFNECPRHAITMIGEDT